MHTENKAEVVVAGHICLDLIPDLGAAGLEALAVPGKLIDVGRIVTSTGGTVANTGLALHRLGVPVRLMGKVGDDAFGTVILDLLRRSGPVLAEDMIVRPGEQSSYSIVISPRGADRIFLHCPGTNDTFIADDVDGDSLEAARLFHFGYPPLMRSMFENGGQELEKLLAKAKNRGLTVSLDMARPDPDSDAGRIDWQSLLKRVLPHVDLFLPSLEETLHMLDGPAAVQEADCIDGDRLAGLGDRLLEMGAAVAAIKLGDQGLYVKTSVSRERLGRMGRAVPADVEGWAGREMLAPCFEVAVAGTTGAGDCTIAGFLCGLLRGLPLERVMTGAVGVGGCNVETVDATSGIVHWDDVWRRIGNGWSRKTVSLPLRNWQYDDTAGVWIGPGDRNAE